MTTHTDDFHGVVETTPDGSVSTVQVDRVAAYVHGLGDILGMALRGEITPDEAQEMANVRIGVLGRIGA